MVKTRVVFVDRLRQRAGLGIPNDSCLVGIGFEVTAAAAAIDHDFAISKHRHVGIVAVLRKRADLVGKVGVAPLMSIVHKPVVLSLMSTFPGAY